MACEKIRGLFTPIRSNFYLKSCTRSSGPYFLFYPGIWGLSFFSVKKILFGSLINLLLALFVIPILAVNFFRKQTIEYFFEFEVLNVVKDNLGDYVVTVLKQYVLSIVFLILSIVLIGIPALFFTNSILIANFYGNYIEQKHTLAFKTQSKDQLTVLLRQIPISGLVFLA